MFLFFLILSFMSSLYMLDINLLLNIMHVCVLSHVQLFATLWTIAHQAPLSIEFSRQEYWSGLPFPPLGYFSQTRDPICVSWVFCIGRWILYCCHLGMPLIGYIICKYFLPIRVFANKGNFLFSNLFNFLKIVISLLHS